MEPLVHNYLMHTDAMVRIITKEILNKSQARALIDSMLGWIIEIIVSFLKKSTQTKMWEGWSCN